MQHLPEFNPESVPDTLLGMSADHDGTCANLGRLADLNVILLGIPGAGKTTLVDSLRTMGEDVNYISLGEISRNLDPDSSQRRELDRLFSLGMPIGSPDLFLDIVEPHLDAALARGSGFILDGIPKKSEEIAPLQAFLTEKGAQPDLVVSCEISPLDAYERVIARPNRTGDPDSMEIFVNRTKFYLRDLAVFKRELTGNNTGAALFVLDTARHQPQPLARALIKLTGGDRGATASPETEASTAAQLHDCIRRGDASTAARILGPVFDDTLDNVDHSTLCDPEISDAERQAHIETAFLAQEPKLQETPHFLQRLAQNYRDTTLASISHLYESLAEEVVLRAGDNFQVADVAEILEQQIGLKKQIEMLQAQVMAGHSLASLTQQEIEANRQELTHIEKRLQARAPLYGIDPAEVTAEALMALQPRLWGQLTSNRILFSPDFNYRSQANGMPDAHHSLLPFTRNERRFAANSMGEYIPFVEAVSATETKYGSTFGFIHFVGMNDNGEAYGAEYPIMMHDRRLLALNSQTITDVLQMTDSFYGNHDLWHNMLPVYARGFILHHQDAPLSYGGRLDAYNEFGEGLRLEKEEYEIGVAMSHARTQHERFADDPDLQAEQEALILGALDKLTGLRDELSGQCSPEEIDDIVDYLACRAATEAYNVLPDDTPVYQTIEAKLIALGVKPLDITAEDVAKLLYLQKLVDPAKLAIVLPDRLFPTKEAKLQAIQASSTIASDVIRNCLDADRVDRESGAEHIVSRLQAWGVIDGLANNPTAALNVIQKSRWLAMVGPQREQLQGHMEKVHGKPGYLFDGRLLTEPRDLVLLQKQAIDRDTAEYQYRTAARAENQQLSYEIYSLLFDDDQDLQRGNRQLLSQIRDSSDVGLSLFAREIVRTLDIVMNELVTNSYATLSGQLDYLESFTKTVATIDAGGAEKALASQLSAIISRYTALVEKETEHQQLLGIRYSNAAQALVDDTMNIA